MVHITDLVSEEYTNMNTVVLNVYQFACDNSMPCYCNSICASAGNSAWAWFRYHFYLFSLFWIALSIQCTDAP